MTNPSPVANSAPRIPNTIPTICPVLRDSEVAGGVNRPVDGDDVEGGEGGVCVEFDDEGGGAGVGVDVDGPTTVTTNFIPSVQSL